LVPHHPQGCLAAQFVEPVDGVDEDYRMWARLLIVSVCGVHGLGEEVRQGGTFAGWLLLRVGGFGRVWGWAIKVLLPSIPKGMDSPLNAGLEAGAEVQVVACGRRLSAYYKYYGLGKEATEDLAYAGRAHARLFVEGDEPAGHEGPVCGPGRMLVGQPGGPLSQLLPQGTGLFAVAQEPVLHVDGVDATSMTGWPVFVQRSDGPRTPPPSRFVTDLTAWRMRPERILAL
jgi:hypothetical protein